MKGSSWFVVMLSQEQVAFIKAMSRLELSAVFLLELWKAVLAAKKKKTPGDPRVPTLPAGIRASTSAGGSAGSQRSSGFVGKRKANELISSGDSSEPAIRRWVRATPCEPQQSDGRTSRLRRPATRVPRGREDLRCCSAVSLQEVRKDGMAATCGPQGTNGACWN
jgi:hypothetical protein